MVLAVFLSTLLITLLGVAYVKGYDYVKQRSPEHLVHFYLIMAAIRMLLIGTTAAVVIILTDDKAEARQFALCIIILYVLMLATTLTLRH